MDPAHRMRTLLVGRLRHGRGRHPLLIEHGAHALPRLVILRDGGGSYHLLQTDSRRGELVVVAPNAILLKDGSGIRRWLVGASKPVNKGKYCGATTPDQRQIPGARAQTSIHR